ncbi:spoU rRNA methylase family protein [Sarocladium implicatum]|nr:spoU rRNA methylase family protein [Sarocladium implicatum]
MIRSHHLALTALKRPISLSTQYTQLSPLATTRAASLSAIHRGLRQSDRIQGTTGRRRPEPRLPRDRQPRRASRDEEIVSGPTSALDSALRQGRRDSGARNSRTAKALAGAATPRQRAKLQKKLAREAEKEAEEDGKQTRRKRFVNPEETHGKRSLVYHLKYGNLKELAERVKLPEPVRPASHRSKLRESRSSTSSRDEAPFQRSSVNPFQLRERNEPRQDRRSSAGRPQPRERDDSFRPRRDDRDSDRSFSDRPRREYQDPNDADVDKARKGGFMPMTVKYTTAASQFLYGRSVVKSALSQARRKLYHLYIYGNEARIDKKDDDAIRSLAQLHNVPITVVPEGEQRLMDKMSTGRPHNGYVLETSPLPQLPVTGLGPLVERPGKLGYEVTLGYQTKEELEVNGEDTFMPRASNATPKPFVLLLNEILDPGNLGGLIRTASYLGVDAIGVTSRSSSTLTPVVLKSAAGAVEEVTIFTVESPLDFITASQNAGWRAYAAVAPPEKKLSNMHAGKFLSTEDVESRDPLQTDPCILVLGNEGHGLPKQIKVASDFEVSVPRFVHSASSVDSLNVSVAAGLLCHSFVKGSAAKARRPGATGAVNLEPEDDVSKVMRANARELF